MTFVKERCAISPVNGSRVFRRGLETRRPSRGKMTRCPRRNDDILGRRCCSNAAEKPARNQIRSFPNDAGFSGGESRLRDFGVKAGHRWPREALKFYDTGRRVLFVADRGKMVTMDIDALGMKSPGSPRTATRIAPGLGVKLLIL